jgi:hypothetical protein
VRSAWASRKLRQAAAREERVPDVPRPLRNPFWPAATASTPSRTPSLAFAGAQSPGSDAA